MPREHNVAARAEVGKARVSYGAEVLLQLGSTERYESFLLGWGMQNVARGKVIGLWVGRAANLLGSSGKIVTGVTEPNIWPKQQPIGPGLSERHTDTAGVHHTSRSDHAIKLHVGVTTDDHRRAESFKDRQEAVIGCAARKDFSVITRCSVAEQHIAKTGNHDPACWGGQPSISR